MKSLGLTDNPLTEFDYHCVDLFSKGLLTKSKTPRGQQSQRKRNRENRKLWAEQFHQYEEQGLSRDELLELLNWFSKHAGDKYTPKAESPVTVFRRYDQLVSAMRRQKDQVDDFPVNREMKDEARRILSTRVCLRWPEPASQEQQWFVEQTFACIVALKRIVREQKIQAEEQDNRTVVWEFLTAVWPTTETMVERWILDTASQTFWIEDWNYSLKGWQMHPRSRRLHTMLKDWLQGWPNRQQIIDQIVSELLEAQKRARIEF